MSTSTEQLGQGLEHGEIGLGEPWSTGQVQKRAIGTFRPLTLDFNCWHVFDFLYETTVTHILTIF